MDYAENKRETEKLVRPKRKIQMQDVAPELMHTPEIKREPGKKRETKAKEKNPGGTSAETRAVKR